MDVPDAEGHAGAVQAAVGMSAETYTHVEVDQIVGSSLWIGRLHSSLVSVLDTVEEDDPGLIEFFNLLPTDLVLEVLPTTALMVAKVKERCDSIIAAIDAALESTADRIVAGETGDEFDNIIYVEFGKGRNE